MMKDLGLQPNDINSLQKMEWSKLIAAGTAAVSKVNPPSRGTAGPSAPGPPRAGWSPCLDDKIINARSFFDVAPDVAKNVPDAARFGSEEGNQMHNRPTEEEWHANLVEACGDDKAPLSSRR
jgi:para-nitrobenzyl esterase